MNILVTGAAGFIGSSFVDRVLSLGHNVTGLDNLSTGQPNFLRLAKNNKKFTFHLVDLLNTKDLSSYFSNIDIVFHFAANADIRFGLVNPKVDLEQNIVATFNVLEAMRSQNIKRIVFSSSAAVLGEPSHFPTPENCLMPVQTSLYGSSKLACEGMISSYCQGYEFEGYVFRFVSLLGPRYPHGHVFDFVKMLRQDSSTLKILGDGNQRKSYLHIEDCLDALMQITIVDRTSLNKSDRYSVFHLGTSDYCKIVDSATWICDELGISPNFEFSGGDRGWIGDNPFVFLDCSAAIQSGWAPKHSIEKSIRETATWLTSNEWIFKQR